MAAIIHNVLSRSIRIAFLFLIQSVLMEPYERLEKARIAAKYDTAVDAARAFGWNEITYTSHENGTRGLTRAAERYAKAFRVTPEWLLYGRGPKSAPVPTGANTVPLVGYVAAGAEATFFGDGSSIDEVLAPATRSDQTVAVEIRGESLGSVFNRWLVYYDNVQRPVSQGLIARLCVVGLKDGRVMVKQLQPSRVRGRFHLISNTEPPIFDAEVDWAAEVIGMSPHH